MYSTCMVIFISFCQKKCHCECLNSPEISTLGILKKLSANEQMFMKVCKSPLKNKGEIQGAAISLSLEKEFHSFGSVWEKKKKKIHLSE